MRVVGIRELKAKLSAYLREVGRGEVFLVTDRDRVVAELRPARLASVERGDPLDEAVRALIESGEATAAARSKADWSWKPPGAGLPEGTGSRVLDELRSDRDGS